MKRVLKFAWIAALAMMLCACNTDQGKGQGQVSVQEEKLQAPYAPLKEVEVPSYEDVSDVAGHFQKYCSGMMVQVIAGNLGGSGVIYDADQNFLWIATAAHVLENMEGNATLIFDDGYEVTTDNVVYAKGQDLVFLKVPRNALIEEESENKGRVDHGEIYGKAKISQDAYDAMRVGDLVVSMGSKSGVGADSYAGVILQDYVWLEDFGAYMIVVDVAVTPGMSGGALLDTKGNLMGILCGVSETGEVAVAPVLALLAMER